MCQQTRCGSKTDCSERVLEHFVTCWFVSNVTLDSHYTAHVLPSSCLDSMVPLSRGKRREAKLIQMKRGQCAVAAAMAGHIHGSTLLTYSQLHTAQIMWAFYIFKQA